MASKLLEITIHKNNTEETPEHHVLTKPSSWTSVLNPWATSSPKEKSIMKRKSREKLQPGNDHIASFQNPWPSFHKPTRQELLTSLAFGADADTSIDLAASHDPEASKESSSKASRDKQAARLLRIENPDFSFDAEFHRSKSTWLGHASMLLQLPSLEPGGSPVRILFDPVFSMRCSPSQSFGPIRSYLPPCNIEDLPPIDVVLISHNHYDHLDSESVKALWKLHSARIRFVVPLKNKRCFTDWGIDADRVEELDWWESVTLSAGESDARVEITCTPAQHGSGRETGDANAALWSSWFVARASSSAGRSPYNVFFAGDTGYQFHADPAWPPRPPRPSGTPAIPSGPKRALSKRVARKESPAAAAAVEEREAQEKHPPCPAFAQIKARLGAPHVLYLPLALGATWAYLKSFTSNYLPAALDPFPRHSPGIAGAIHMPPWDAVRVLREMTDRKAEDSDGEAEAEAPIAIGMHWGTFVTDQTEVLKTLGQLEWACREQGVEFGRGVEWPGETQEKARFLALHHGRSVVT